MFAPGELLFMCLSLKKHFFFKAPFLPAFIREALWGPKGKTSLSETSATLAPWRWTSRLQNCNLVQSVHKMTEGKTIWSIEQIHLISGKNRQVSHTHSVITGRMICEHRRAEAWSTDSETLDDQRTHPQGASNMRTHTEETTRIQGPASPNHQQHPVQDSSSEQQAKQKHNPNHQQTGLPPHSALPVRGKTNKQTKTQHKSHPIWSLHKPLDQP